MGSEPITITIRGGAAFCAVMDTLDLAREMLELIPEWHKEDRERFAESISVLDATIDSTMQVESDSH